MPAVSDGRPEGGREVAPSVPDRVSAAALAAFSSRDRDAVLAELVTDSADDDGGSDGAEERSLVFAGGGMNISLRLRRDAVSQTLTADIVVEPPPAGEPEVDVRGRVVPAVVAVAPGRWSLSPLTSGPLRIVLVLGGQRVQTEWMRC